MISFFTFDIIIIIILLKILHLLLQGRTFVVVRDMKEVLYMANDIKVELDLSFQRPGRGVFVSFS